MATQLEKLAYETKYTAGAYLDSILSIPIWAGDKIIKGAKKIMGKNNHDSLDPNEIMKRSPLYKGRQRLRNSLDTRPGALYIQSNIVGAIPFFLVGMPAAESAAAGIEHIASEAPEIAKHIGISLTTLGCQMATGYSAFVANEVRTNRHKYENEEGKLDFKKIGKMTWDAAKTFWKFDLSYILGKTVLQTGYLMADKDPWEASALADTIGLPLWYTLAIPFGLRGGLIDTKITEEIYERESSMKNIQDI